MKLGGSVKNKDPHPLPTSPQLFAHPRRAPSALARFFARLFDLSLRTADVFPVVPKRPGTIGNTSAVRRLVRSPLGKGCYPG